MSACQDKENVAVQNKLSALSIGEPAKKRGWMHKASDKKQKQHSGPNDEARPHQLKNHTNKVLGGEKHHIIPLKPKGFTKHHKKHQNHETSHHSMRPFVIRATNADVDLSKATALHWRHIHDSIQVDPALQHHMAMLTYSTNMFMAEQQQRAFYMQEQTRRNEIAKWLSTKTEVEQKEYLERIRQPIH